MKALDIGKATVAGHDWGGRTGYALAALWPEKVERLVVQSVAYITEVPDGASLEQASSFSGGYRRGVLPGVGHFIPRERPEAIIATLVDAD